MKIHFILILLASIVAVAGGLTAAAQFTAPRNDKAADRSLAEVIREFNDKARDSDLGRNQKPITEDEVRDLLQKLGRRDDLSKEDHETIVRAEESGKLPGHVSLRHFTRFDDGEQFHHVWWVRLTMMRDNGSVRTFPVRSETIFTRPFTQKEREFKDSCETSGGIPVLNRLSAYFEGDPKFGQESRISRESSQRLVDVVQKAANDKDLDTLMNLYDWSGIDKRTREFVRGEMQQVLERKVKSIEVTPRRYGGQLRHWQGFSGYEPNLPIVGYLKIETIAGDDSPQNGKPNALWLELGLKGDELRLVNYTEQKRELPKEKLALTATGHLEDLGNGIYDMTWTNMSPGPILSAKLANEEVWRRGRK